MQLPGVHGGASKDDELMPGLRNIKQALSKGGYSKKKFEKESLALYDEMRRRGLKPVGFHKEVFGKQDFCGKRADSPQRFWVWELGQGRAWAANSKGMVLEVHANVSYRKAVQFWKRYCRCLLGEV